ncbi:hypothetical protein [Burkholderia gladioli]|uniref:hypothetical protein n=2 Tax=Burkholderia gladioli TaxID=28095 RepID=UPI0026502E73|nr:hypothetical protein [Burkholderia gladioli]MDN7739571.1 hypothetical protein [Burkholderia gladioli]
MGGNLLPLVIFAGAQAWDLLAPLFQLFGANGLEREEDVLMGALFVASFVIALLIIWMASKVLRRTRKAAWHIPSCVAGLHAPQPGPNLA